MFNKQKEKDHRRIANGLWEGNNDWQDPYRHKVPCLLPPTFSNAALKQKVCAINSDELYKQQIPKTAVKSPASISQSDRFQHSERKGEKAAYTHRNFDPL